MSEPKWRREGPFLYGPHGSRNQRCISVNDYAGNAWFDEMLADANYGAAIRLFAEAAEKAIRGFCATREALDGEWLRIDKRSPIDENMLAALALLPSQPEPAPTLAEQGEEIKKLIDESSGRIIKSTYSRISQEERDRLKDMVDAIVASGKEERS